MQLLTVGPDFMDGCANSGGPASQLCVQVTLCVLFDRRLSPGTHLAEAARVCCVVRCHAM